MSAPSTATAVRPLVARTRETAPAADLLQELGPGGFAWLRGSAGFVTRGVVARVPASRALDALAGIELEGERGEPGIGPLAVGAFPFDPAAPWTCTVPARIVGTCPDGRGWITEVRPADEPATRADPPRGAAQEPEPGTFAVEPATTRREWRASVASVGHDIAGGSVAKVVLARVVDVRADAAFRVDRVAGRLRDLQPGCITFAGGGLVGSTPEILVHRRGSTVRSAPMAGTALAADAEHLAALARSAKDSREHRFVTDAIATTLGPWCDGPVRVEGPVAVPAGQIAHLASRVEGRLRAPAASALAIARLLHPTPAVAGTPTADALALLGALEPCGRDRYAAPVGWVDPTGDGDFAIALRCAALDGSVARLWAGAGIVAGSDADAEWDETAAKLEPMLRALVRP